MRYERFEQPVSIFLGLGFETTVETVAHAYSLLVDWPVHRRTPAHEMALNACRAALRREVDAETARSTFAAFARKQGILAPEPLPVIAARATGRMSSRSAVR